MTVTTQSSASVCFVELWCACDTKMPIPQSPSQDTSLSATMASPSPSQSKSSRHSLAQADKLESKLKALVSNSKGNANGSSNDNTNTEPQAAELRVKLCELFSDIILSDPIFGLRKDVTNRLWYSCFYDRIQELRSRIRVVKEKLRKKEREQARILKHNAQVVVNHSNNKNDANGGIDSDIVTTIPEINLEKYQQRVENAQQGLHVFIKEGILLYDYLVEQFHGKLSELVHGCGSTLSQSQSQSSHIQSQSQTQESQQAQTQSPSQSQNTLDPQSQSQLSLSSKSASSNLSSSIALVPITHKLYIHLGDLHRYASSFAKAEQSYLQASVIAPPKGNPYNQMAVVAQLRDGVAQNPMSAVALYWYARSLSAKEVFETSKSNVERLFHVNDKWLKKNLHVFSGSVSLAHILMESKKAIEKNGGENMNGEIKEQAKTVKKTTSQIVLSRFVAFHGELFRLGEREIMEFEKIHAGSNKTNNEEDDKEPQKDTDVNKDEDQRQPHQSNFNTTRNEILAQIQEILEINPFSDALAQKLVFINAFSLWRCWKLKQRLFHKMRSRSRSKGNYQNELKSLNEIQNQRSSASATAEAFAFCLEFSSVMAKAMRLILYKTVNKLEPDGNPKSAKSNNNSPYSIRFLGPLLLLCEYISHNLSTDEFASVLFPQFEADKELIQNGIENFWREIGEIGTIITTADELSNIMDESTVRNDARILPDEFASVSKGCTPFNFLSDEGSRLSTNDLGEGMVKIESSEEQTGSGGAYVTPEQAIKALEISAPEDLKSPSKKKSKKKSSGNFESAKFQTKIKLARFMAFVSKHVGSGELVSEDGKIEVAPRLVHGNNNSMSDREANDGDTVMEECVNTDFAMSPGVEAYVGPQRSNAKTAEAEEDILVYKQSEQGQPALLVPSALLMGNTSFDAALGLKSESEEKTEGGEKASEDDGSSLLKLTSMIIPKKPQQPHILPLDPEPEHPRAEMTNPQKISLPQGESKQSMVRPPPGFQIPDTHNESPGFRYLPSNTNPAIPAGMNMNSSSTTDISRTLPIHLQPIDTRSGPPGFHPMPSSVNVNPVPAPQAKPIITAQTLPTYGVHPNANFIAPLPQTRNPFASRLTQSYGVNIVTDSSLAPHSNPNSFASGFVPSSLGHNHGADAGISLTAHGSDPFGLRSLGIFSDDSHQPSSNEKNEQFNVNASTSASRPNTRNPFY